MGNYSTLKFIEFGHFGGHRNSASARVLEKIRDVFEGVLRRWVNTPLSRIEPIAPI